MSIRHVGLRPFCLQDAASFTRAVNESLPSLTPWMTWAHDNYCSDEASSWINFTHIQRAKREAEEFAIVDENDQLLGGAGIRFTQQPGEFCALGYWVRSTAQRQGVATRAVAQLIALGFQSPEVKLLEILAAADSRHF